MVSWMDIIDEEIIYIGGYSSSKQKGR